MAESIRIPLQPPQLDADCMAMPGRELMDINTCLVKSKTGLNLAIIFHKFFML